MAAAREPIIMDRIRAKVATMVEACQEVLQELDATNGNYPAIGGNTFTDAYLDAHGASGTVDQTYDMTKAEWQAFWPTARTVATISAANLASLEKGLLR